MSNKETFQGSGVVRHLKDQFVPTLGTRMMTFELEQENKRDGKKRHIAVQMEGLGFTGAINNGQVVDVEGVMTDGRVLSQRIVNKSVNDCVVAPRTSHPLLIKAMLGIGIFSLVIFVIIAITAVTIISKLL